MPGVASQQDLEALQKQHEYNVKSFERLRLEYSKELFEMRDRIRTLPEAPASTRHSNFLRNLLVNYLVSEIVFPFCIVSNMLYTLYVVSKSVSDVSICS